MKTLRTLTMLVIAVAVLTGCAHRHITEPLSGVPLEPLKGKATYQLLGPTEGTSSGGVLFWFISIGGERKSASLGSVPILNPVVSAAHYNAIDKCPEADALLAPRVSIESKNYFVYKYITATVKGKAIKYIP